MTSFPCEPGLRVSEVRVWAEHRPLTSETSFWSSLDALQAPRGRPDWGKGGGGGGRIRHSESLAIRMKSLQKLSEMRQVNEPVSKLGCVLLPFGLGLQ